MTQCMTERLKKQKMKDGEKREEKKTKKNKAGVGGKDEREAGREGGPGLYSEAADSDL